MSEQEFDAKYLDEQGNYKPRVVELSQTAYLEIAEALNPHERFGGESGGLVFYTPNGVHFTFKAKRP